MTTPHIALLIQARDAMQGVEKLFRANGFCMNGTSTTPFMEAIAALTAAIDAGEPEPAPVKLLTKDQFPEFCALLRSVESEKVAAIHRPLAPLTDEQIEKIREKTFSTNNPFCPVDSKSMRKAARAIEAALGVKP